MEIACIRWLMFSCSLYREAVFVHDHKTSRQCDDPKCRGELHDSIINFGEMLPEAELRSAIAHARKVGRDAKSS